MSHRAVPALTERQTLSGVPADATLVFPKLPMNNATRSIPGTLPRLISCIRTVTLLSLLWLAAGAMAQQVSPGLLQAMKWRLIGPFRGGRVTSVCGVPSQPDVYYMGTPGGGVWKTDDGGTVWRPIFDQAGVASIGAVAVSPSNPNIMYVGTGEQTQGNGIYKSTDGGVTWANLGLRDT